MRVKSTLKCQSNVVCTSPTWIATGALFEAPPLALVLGFDSSGMNVTNVPTGSLCMLRVLIGAFPVALADAAEASSEGALKKKS